MDRSLTLVIVEALDLLALALAEESHIWTQEERGLYEFALSVLKEEAELLMV